MRVSTRNSTANMDGVLSGSGSWVCVFIKRELWKLPFDNVDLSF